jgi:alpha/beta superfamily hydrolase
MVDKIYDANSGRGQLMERSTVVQSGPNTLEGIYLRGNKTPPVLVVPAVHQPGGSMEGSVANEIAYQASFHGHPSLRFAWQGQGASEGDLPAEGESLAPLQVDLQHSVQHLLECEDAKELVLIGLRDGSVPILEYARGAADKVAMIILIDPPGQSAVRINDIATFIFFPGEEIIPREFHDFDICSVVRIPKADRAFRRSLNLLGQSVVNLLRPA